MERILTIILIICICMLVQKLLARDTDHFVPNDINKPNIPLMYPISTEHNYDNMENLVQVGALGKINELSDALIQKTNEGTHMILFNTALRQTDPLPLNENEIIDYGKFLVNTMNEVAIYKKYKYDGVIGVSKDQMENQVRLNFHLKMIYASSDSEKLPLQFNVVFLFEHLYDDDGKFFDRSGKENNNTSTYLDEFRLLNLPNNGFLPGYDPVV